MCRSYVLLVGLWLLSGAVLAHPLVPSDSIPVRPAGPPALQPLRVRTAPLIDGRLDEDLWGTAAVASGFTQRHPDAEQPSTERTEVRVLYDDEAVYVGFTCYTRDPSTILARLARRDDRVTSDHVAVAFDSYDDRRTAFVFIVNAAGVLRDELVYNDTQSDDSWDAIWEAAVSRDNQGWTAELRIPFSQLRFAANRDVQDWGIQFTRDIPARGESSWWAPFPPTRENRVSSSGRLVGLERLPAPRRLEVVPYIASSLKQLPGDAANPFYHANDLNANVGVDLKYGLTSNLTLAATVNPDFGQVEADPAVVNLTAYENFLREQRPFFVEGVDIFEYGQSRSMGGGGGDRPTFFYSRRIGRTPQRGLWGYDYVDSPLQTTILGATKLSGKVGGFSVGILDAVTTREMGRWYRASPNGQAAEEGEAPVEPWTNYLVGRVKRDFRSGQSVIGGLVTAVNRKLSDDPSFADLLAGSAYVGGLDFEHQFAKRQWSITGILTGSTVNGSRAVITTLQQSPQRVYQRPDADHLAVDSSATHLRGYYSQLSIAKINGEHWTGSLTGTVVSPGFDVNNLGFQNRSDTRSVSGFVEYNELSPRLSALLNYGLSVRAGSSWNYGGDRTDSYVGGSLNGRLRNRWGGNVGATYALASYDDRLTRGGPLARTPSSLRFNGNVHSDFSKPVTGFLFGSYRREATGGYNGSVSLSLSVRPSDALELEAGPSFSMGANDRQYVQALLDPAVTTTFGTRYLFAETATTSLGLSLRANWLFSPTLSLQFYAEPSLSKYRYANYKEFTTPGELDFAVYGQDKGSITPKGAAPVTVLTIDPQDGGAPFDLGNRDFNFRALRGNAVLRWEYRPGSTLFLVWQQQRDSYAAYEDRFGVGRDFGALFDQPVQNVFLAKLSYWLGA